MQSGRDRSFIDLSDNGRPGIKRYAQRKIKENLQDEESEFEEVKEVNDHYHDNDDVYLPPEASRNIDGKKSPMKPKSQIAPESFKKLQDITQNFTLTFKEIADDMEL